MRVLLIGGTGFTGPPLVSQLLERGHDVVVYHRGQTHDERTCNAREIIGDRRNQQQLSDAIATAAPDIVVDMIPFTADDAAITRNACRDVVSRVVAVSSIDVYLAFGRIHGTEPGALQETPLTETSALRTTDQPGGPDVDKVSVERSLLEESQLPVTILRLPAIYGPRDKYRRLRGYLKRMDDGRETILLGETLATWKFSRGFVDNVANAIVLAVEHEDARGEIFNVAEPQAMTELEFVQAIGTAAGWKGNVRIIPDNELPESLQQPVNFEQNWDVDTQKIRTRLEYTEIVDASEAFQRTVEWERMNPPDAEPFECNYAAEDAALAG